MRRCDFPRRRTAWQLVRKTAAMNKSNSNARQSLEVTIMFEPTRLAATHLADAYAQVVPLRLRAVPSPVATPPELAKENVVALTAGGRS